MSTIAYKDGCMAADRKLSADGVLSGEVNKVEIIEGQIVAWCGDIQDFIAFKEWFCDGCKHDDRPTIDSFGALSVDSSGNVKTYDNKCRSYQVKAPFHVNGSGHAIAVGAMAAGASAEEAVRIACVYDCNSGCGVDVITLEELREYNERNK